jgi:hypothetical protein
VAGHERARLLPRATAFVLIASSPTPHPPPQPKQRQADARKHLGRPSLHAYAATRAGLTESQLRFTAAQLLCALDFLHGQDPPVLHRDIKPLNCVVFGDADADGSEEGQGGGAASDKSSLGARPLNRVPRVKLTDFGFARTLLLEEGQTAAKMSVLGSPGFTAPEVFAKAPYNTSADVFAAGRTVMAVTPSGLRRGEKATVADLELSLADAWGRGPAAATAAAAAATDSGAAGLFPPGPQVGEEGRSLLTSLLSPVPGDRPSPREALAHPWFDPIRAAFTRLFGVDVLEDVARARDAEAAREAEAAAARRRAEEGEAAEAAERERAEQLRRRLQEEEEEKRAEAAGAAVVAAVVGSGAAGDDEKVPVSSLPVAVPVPAEPALLDAGPAPAPLVPDPVAAAAAAVDDGPSPPLAPDAEADAPAVESASSPHSRSAPLSHAATVVGDGEPDSLRFRDFFVFAPEDKIGE